MEQQDLIHEDWRDALRHAVKAMGGFDVVGAELWPGKTRRAAGAWLSDAINPERAAKLDLEELLQLLRLARAKGLHIGLHFLCDELGYTRPSPVEPSDQEAEIGRQLDANLKTLDALTSRLARIRGTVTQ
ncbi:MAG: hypothetical protein Q8N51_00730 [Gammaproteobacteria bacterium]|nr:hypothetical protein [Gammaproteobacteria bacterium]